MKNFPFCMIVCLLLVEFTGCKSDSEAIPDSIIELSEGPDLSIDSTILIPVEAISMDYFPCNDCHSELEPNTQRRELVDMHDDIVFDHDSENRWCLACHNTLRPGFFNTCRAESFLDLMNLTNYADSAMVPNTGIGNLESMVSVQENGTGKSNICCVSIVMIPIPPSLKDMQPLPSSERYHGHIYIDSIYEKPETKSNIPIEVSTDETS